MLMAEAAAGSGEVDHTHPRHYWASKSSCALGAQAKFLKLAPHWPWTLTASFRGASQPTAMRRWFLALAAFSVLVHKAGGARQAAYTLERRYPHDTNCFTEGLILTGSSEVIESCGLTGRSYLRWYKLESGTTLRRAVVPSEFFAEGLALIADSLYMLTYQHHLVIEFSAITFSEVRRHAFPYGEGWGLTTDGCDLYATTGAPYIYRLRPDSFGAPQLLRKVEVKNKGQPVRWLNELEYVTPSLWVNQWHSNTLFRVNPDTGDCEVQVDIQGLRSWSGEMTPNGIAYSASLDPNQLLVTGKLWDEIFALQFAPTDLCGAVAEQSQPTCTRAPPSPCWEGQRPTPSVPGSVVPGLSTPTVAAGTAAAIPPTPSTTLAPTTMPGTMTPNGVSTSFPSAATASAHVDVSSSTHSTAVDKLVIAGEGSGLEATAGGHDALALPAELPRIFTATSSVLAILMGAAAAWVALCLRPPGWGKGSAPRHGPAEMARSH